ncbi:hypothetical protein MJ575_04810 [Klebsiella pneumoniae]|nr:hypothetical protein MJ575_04810 [Klebsiella pneumoniae]
MGCLRELKKACDAQDPAADAARGQNLLGYRHTTPTTWWKRFVERAVKNGMDVFRVFDAMNDLAQHAGRPAGGPRHGAHAQGTFSYTTSLAHTPQTWLDLTPEQLLEDPR